MKLVRSLGLPLLIFTAIVVQRTAIGEATIAGVHPDFVLLMVAAIGATRGRETGALTGFFAGLVVDSFVTTPFGLSALVYAIAGYLAGEVERFSDAQPLTLRILLVGGASLAGEALLSVALFLLGLGDPFKGSSLEEIVVVGGVNLMLAPAALLLARLVFGPGPLLVSERR